MPEASITGGVFTLTVTESLSHRGCGSQTWSSNVSTAGPVGALNAGVAEVGSFNITAGPAVWVTCTSEPGQQDPGIPIRRATNDIPETTVWSGRIRDRREVQELVPTPVPSAITAPPMALERFTSNVSVSSTRPSSIVCTVTVSDVSPGSKVSVPEVGV